MAFDTYANFRTVVYNHLDVSTGDITTTSLDDVVLVGENYVNRKLRVNQMETALAVTINSAGVATYPTDYMDAAYLYVTSSPNQILQKKAPEFIFRDYGDRNYTGIPKFVAEDAGTFIFGPAPNSTYTVRGTYYARPASLPGTATINSVFSAYPEIYLWAALANAELYLSRDDRVAWQQKCDEAINRANTEERRKRSGGGPIRSQPG